MHLGLENKTAIVSAASRGLGRACAESLAREGVDVTIMARSADALEATAREIADAALVEGMSATQVFACSSNDEAISTALERIRDGDMILVKGSRGMKMETIVDSIDLKFRERKNG